MDGIDGQGISAKLSDVEMGGTKSGLTNLDGKDSQDDQDSQDGQDGQGDGLEDVDSRVSSAITI
jgi:hypothetical protein